jgi:hypothetical protein
LLGHYISKLTARGQELLELAKRYKSWKWQKHNTVTEEMDFQTTADGVTI